MHNLYNINEVQWYYLHCRYCTTAVGIPKIKTIKKKPVFKFIIFIFIITSSNAVQQNRFYFLYIFNLQYMIL